MNSRASSVQAATPSGAFLGIQTAVHDALIFALHRRSEEFPGLAEFVQDQVVFHVSLEARRPGVLGYFCSGGLRVEGRSVCEIHVFLPEILTAFPLGERGEQVYDTALHEAAHAWLYMEGIKGTSRGGRWHNARFRDVAEGLGLRTVASKRVGHATVGLDSRARQEYAHALADLEAALVLDLPARVPSTGPDIGLPPTGGDGSSTASACAGVSPKHVSAACLCRSPRRVRVAMGSWVRGPIVCGLCGSAFAPIDGALSAERR